MKKIPTLFKREFENGKVVGITDKVQDGFEWVLTGEGRQLSNTTGLAVQ